MDHTRFMGRDIEVEFTRGYRKSKDTLVSEFLVLCIYVIDFRLVKPNNY